MSRRQGRSNRRRSVVTADGMPIIDGFRVDEQIGEGGFSQVYRGSQETPARPAAIKVFRTSGDVGARVRERFQRECSVIGELSSLDGLVTVFTGGFTLAGAPYLAMELCDGGSMSSHVANHGPLDVDEVVTVGTRIGSALASVHARGVTHRDVKPSNILMASGGRALLTDFGLASMGQISEAFGEESRVAMTEVYAPPERLDPDNTPGQATDAAGDQYSFALTLYAMLLGASPIPGETTGARILKAAKGERKPLNRSDVSTEVLGVLLRAMAPIPADRWPSMAGMVEALGSASGRAGPQSSHGSASRPSPPAQMPVGLRPPPKPSSPWYQTEAELTSEPKNGSFDSPVPEPRRSSTLPTFLAPAPEEMMRPGSAVPAQPGESDLLREAPTSLVSKVEGSATPASGPAWKRPVIIGAVVAASVFLLVVAAGVLRTPEPDPLPDLIPTTSAGPPVAMAPPVIDKVRRTDEGFSFTWGGALPEVPVAVVYQVQVDESDTSNAQQIDRDSSGAPVREQFVDSLDFDSSRSEGIDLAAHKYCVVVRFVPSEGGDGAQSESKCIGK